MQDKTEFRPLESAGTKEFQIFRLWKILFPFLLALASLFFLDGCHSRASGPVNPANNDATILTFTSLVDGSDADFEMQTLDHFASGRRNLRIRYIPDFESVDSRLAMYKQLFKERSPQPDLCEIDVIWPGMIADDLLDLTPYFHNEIQSFPPELLRSYTVHGRLIAIPLFLDSGLLYFRSDLLRKYGFKGPPKTWDDLERMAKVIQEGQRRSGDPNFWGYVWQGSASEALTCNALEWQASQGGGHIIEPDGAVSVCNVHAVLALERAVSWIGKISPPGVTAYTEDDSLNIYADGHAAFMRNWSSIYGTVRDRAVRGQTALALLPAGAGGSSRTMGGIAGAVSRYSEHRDEAVAALRDLVSGPSQIRRATQVGIAPTRLALERRPDLMLQTAFHGPLLSGQILTGLVMRPSLVTGSAYGEVSKAYYSAIHSALTKQVAPATALAQLQTRLVQITRNTASQ